MPNFVLEGNIIFIILVRKQICPVPKKGTPSLSSEQLCYTNILEKIVQNQSNYRHGFAGTPNTGYFLSLRVLSTVWLPCSLVVSREAGLSQRGWFPKGWSRRLPTGMTSLVEHAAGPGPSRSQPRCKGRGNRPHLYTHVLQGGKELTVVMDHACLPNSLPSESSDFNVTGRKHFMCV